MKRLLKGMKNQAEEDLAPISIKLVVVGDGAVGKTCILYRYTNKEFLDEYIPTIFENQSMMVKVDKKSVQLGLWDTAGQEEFNRLRPLSYSKTDIFFIVFSLVEPDSFENALKKWYPELQQVSPKSQKVFIGNKTDLLEMNEYKTRVGKNAPINSEKVKEIISDLGCTYYECSAKENTGIKELFLSSLTEGVSKKNSEINIQRPKKRFRCTLI